MVVSARISASCSDRQSQPHCMDVGVLPDCHLSDSTRLGQKKSKSASKSGGFCFHCSARLFLRRQTVANSQSLLPLFYEAKTRSVSTEMSVKTFRYRNSTQNVRARTERRVSAYPRGSRQYLRRNRLERACNGPLDASQDVSDSDIAFDCGFLHLGRFSLESKTLRRIFV